MVSESNFENPNISKSQYFVVGKGEMSWKGLTILASKGDINPSSKIFVGRTSEWVIAKNIPTLSLKMSESKPSEIVAKYCRNCGKDINAKTEICTNCGVRPLTERNFCHECGVETKHNQEICIKCGVGFKTLISNTASGIPLNTAFSGLPQYYQDEFKKIYESNEIYKGKWNWAAFFFGPIWALTKGIWVAPLIDIVASIATMGIAGVIYWLIFAVRGNYMYYSYVTKNKQLPI